MDATIENLTKELDKNGPADQEILKKVLAELDFIPPHDYIQFIKTHNGAEGVINESYLQLLPIEELNNFNLMYESASYAPVYFIFGSNLGGTAYAFNKGNNEIVAFELVDMVSEDLEVIGTDFVSFLKKLADA